MKKLDELIEQALSAEDRQLLAEQGEPGYVTQAFGMFRGELGWVVWVTYVSGLIAFAAGGYLLWQAWSATEVLVAVKYGVSSLLLFQIALMTKSFLGSHFEANRTRRELKRLELQVSVLATAAHGGRS